MLLIRMCLLFMFPQYANTLLPFVWKKFLAFTNYNRLIKAFFTDFIRSIPGSLTGNWFKILYICVIFSYRICVQWHEIVGAQPSRWEMNILNVNTMEHLLYATCNAGAKTFVNRLVICGQLWWHIRWWRMALDTYIRSLWFHYTFFEKRLAF